MARPEVRVVVLFEDRAHEKFLRRLVERLGLNPVRYERCIDSNGVLARVAREVEALRSRNFQANLGLILMIDADDQGLEGLRTDLLHRIRESGGQDRPRSATERMVLLVPALEVENWYVHLCCPEARPIAENKDYKGSHQWRKLEKDLGLAARKAIDEWSQDVGREDPPSMLMARTELKRIA